MAIVGKLRASLTVGLMLSAFMLALVSLPTVSAENVRLYCQSEIRNDGWVLTVNEGDDAGDVLNQVDDHVFGDGDWGDTNIYDGDPGIVYWGNGTYGTAVIKVGLTDITGASSDYWSVDVILNGDICGEGIPWEPGDTHPDLASGIGHIGISARVGFGSGPYEGWNGSTTYYGGTGGVGGYHYNIMNNDSGNIPWTTAQVNAGFVIIEARWDLAQVNTLTPNTPPLYLALCWMQVQVQSETYTPPPDPTAQSFILRPDADLYNFNWHPIPTDDLFDNLNETTYFSDSTTTYIRSLWAQGHIYRMGMTDPPDAALRSSYYAVSFWMIAKENVTNTVDTLNAAIGTVIFTGDAFQPFGLKQDVLGSFDLSTSWSNQTIPWVQIPYSSDVNWTYEQLENATINIMPSGNDPYGGICVSQIALLCTPTSAIPSADIPETYEDISGWLRVDGIQTIFGVLGFLLLLVSPAVIVFKSHDEGGIAAFFYAGLIAVMGIGFLWAGLAGHWESMISGLSDWWR